MQETAEGLRKAIQLAQRSRQQGGLPIGSTLELNGVLVGLGHNRRDQYFDPTAHAEIDCLRDAGLLIGAGREAILYSTLSPCWMCAGAARVFGKIAKVVVADAGEGVPFVDSWRAPRSFFEDAGIEFVVSEDEGMKATLRDFLEKNPQLWAGDVGAQT